MKAMPRQVSVYLLSACVLLVLALIGVGDRFAAEFLGLSIATILDLRFVVVVAFAAIFIKRVNVLILALACSIVLNIYFQLTLQEIWRELGKEFNLLWDICRKLPAFILVLSGLHLLLGDKESPSQ